MYDQSSIATTNNVIKRTKREKNGKAQQKGENLKNQNKKRENLKSKTKRKKPGKAKQKGENL